MLKRIITSIVAVLIFIPILWFSHTPVFTAAIAIVSVTSLYEMFKCMGVHKKYALTVPMYISAVAFPTLQRMIDNEAYVVTIAFVAAGIYIVYLFALVIWSHGSFTYNNAGSVFLTSLYILISLNMVIYIRDFGESGKYLYLLIFIGAWITDIFAYFTGFFFGKHKLIEDVSPKKTIEGSIGGTLFCAIAFALFGVAIDIFFEGNANIIFLAISGIIIAIIAQIGDLIMSVIKRQYNIKDYGKIFPGHGGMLDRFDSVLAVSLGVALVCMFSYMTGIQLI